MLCVMRIFQTAAVRAASDGGNGLILNNIHAFLTSPERRVKLLTKSCPLRKECCIAESCDWTSISLSELVLQSCGYRNIERFKNDVFFHLGGIDLYAAQ